MMRIGIFASGTGSNAQKIIDYFKNKNPDIIVSLIVCNNPNAKVLEVAKKHGIKSLLITKVEFNSQEFLHTLENHAKLDLIVLAGFLWLIPKEFIRKFKGKIINIHPALLPGFGGKGMYGMAVHKAVKESGNKETGITIHYVNENFDEGEIIFQAKCSIKEKDTPESIALKIQKMEHKHYPRIIESLV
ncbi:MAG: phosphoribosylglycinamide formyltransferase [Bacteroidetes bacterium]|nr:phosphoribosylglycinamide formyltransferase [Bacteroidota bacterium]HET6245457.1 phosphoribosylglycinamide formyltransferase [Bacteroidia bacterium]